VTQAKKKKGIAFFLVILFAELPSLGFSICKGSSLTELLPCPLLFLEKISAPPTDHHPSSFYFRITVLFPSAHRKKNPFIRLQSLESEGSSLNTQGKLFLIKPQPVLP